MLLSTGYAHKCIFMWHISVILYWLLAIRQSLGILVRWVLTIFYYVATLMDDVVRRVEERVEKRFYYVSLAETSI